MKVKLLLMIIILLSTVFVVSADKIQTDDNWIYIDSNKTQYNETVIEIIQYDDGYTRDLIAVAVIDTDRVAPFPQHPNINVSYAGEGDLYVTQEGGIPLFSTQRIEGEIKFDTEWIPVNETPIYVIDETPASAIATAETVNYELDILFKNITGENDDHFIHQEFVISTDQTITDNVRNYTISTLDISIYPSANENPLDLYQSSDATLITWDSEIKTPKYIAQTEPQKIRSVKGKNNLALSQAYSFTEYFLSDNIISTLSQSTTSSPQSTEDDSLFNSSMIVLGIATIVLARPIRKKIER